MKIKKVLLSFIICIILALNTKPTFANSILQNIEVLINNVSLFVNNEQIAVDNLLYNGTTYVPLRAVAEMNGMEVKWDEENKRVDLVSNETFNMKTTDGKYNIIGVNPKPFTDGKYFQWNYLNIVFDSNTKKIIDNKKVVLVDYKGNRIDVECQPGINFEDNFNIVTKKRLELNTYYSLYIPKNNIMMENSDLYGEEILIYFKTATNVISGKVSSEDDLFRKPIVIKDNNGKEYTNRIIGKNEFYFTNIPAGNYEVIIDGTSYGNISIKENIINEVKAIKK